MATASGVDGFKQSRGYFVPLGNCVDKIFQYTGSSGAGGSFLPGNFTAVNWVATGTTGPGAGALLSSISSIGQGGLLRDMGKTVVSSNRTFRKVQLITRQQSLGVGVTTGGVTNGQYGATDFTSQTQQPYLTGYIELSTGNAGLPPGSTAAAPVAYMPGFM